MRENNEKETGLARGFITLPWQSQNNRPHNADNGHWWTGNQPLTVPRHTLAASTDSLSHIDPHQVPCTPQAQWPPLPGAFHQIRDQQASSSTPPLTSDFLSGRGHLTVEMDQFCEASLSFGSLKRFHPETRSGTQAGIGVVFVSRPGSSGVKPLLFSALKSASAEIRSWTASMLLFLIARWRGVSPFLFFALESAPAAMSALLKLLFLLFTARCRGVLL